MKTLVLILIFWFAFSLPLKASDSISSKRQELLKIEEERKLALMNKLAVTPASDSKTEPRTKAFLSEKSMGDLGYRKVKHEVFRNDDNSIIGESLYILDEAGKTKAFIEIKDFVSIRAAQDNLFNKLQANIMPLEEMLRITDKKDDGPGDICIVHALYADNPKIYSRRQLPIYFMKNNLVVSVCSLHEDIIAMELAKEVGTIIAGSMEQQGKHSPEPR